MNLKRFTLFLLFILVAYMSCSTQPKEVPLIIFWGESNVPGWGQKALAFEEELATNPRLQIYIPSKRLYYTERENERFYAIDFSKPEFNQGDWSGMAKPESGHSFELPLSKYAREGLFGDTLYLVKIGYGGSKFKHWAEGATTNCDLILKNAIDSAYIQIRRRGFEPKPYLVMSLGINDINGKTPLPAFKAHTIEIVSRYRKHIDENAPVVVTKIPSCMGKRPAEKYNQLYKEIESEDSLFYTVETSDLEMFECVHYDHEGWDVLGDRILTKLDFLSTEKTVPTFLDRLYFYFNWHLPKDKDEDQIPDFEEIRIGTDPQDRHDFPENPVVYHNFNHPYQKSRRDDLSIMGYDATIPDSHFVYIEDFRDTLLQADNRKMAGRHRGKQFLDNSKVLEGRLLPNKEGSTELLGNISIGVENEFEELIIDCQDIKLEVISYSERSHKRGRLEIWTTHKKLSGQQVIDLSMVKVKNIYLKITFNSVDSMIDEYRVKFKKKVNI